MGAKKLENFHALLLLAELPIAIFALCLNIITYARHLRSALWDIGGVNGWNSNPRLRVYFAANHKEPPEIPLVWSHELDYSLLAIAILGVVVWFVRASLLYFKMSSLGINVFYDAILSGLWMYGVAAQMSGDFTDLKHPSSRPWYLQRGCSEISDKKRSYCCLGKLSFGLAVLCGTTYLMRFAFSLLSPAYSFVKRRLVENNDEALYGLWESMSAKSPYLATSNANDNL